jgi:hypothetical protein
MAGLSASRPDSKQQQQPQTGSERGRHAQLQLWAERHAVVQQLGQLEEASCLQWAKQGSHLGGKLQPFLRHEATSLSMMHCGKSGWHYHSNLPRQFQLLLLRPLRLRRHQPLLLEVL